MAREYVYDNLARSAMVKFCKKLLATWNANSSCCLYDKPDYEAADVEPGTWWEFLRWGSTYLEQRRRFRQALMPLSTLEESDEVIIKGYLEPCDKRARLKDMRSNQFISQEAKSCQGPYSDSTFNEASKS